MPEQVPVSVGSQAGDEGMLLVSADERRIALQQPAQFPPRACSAHRDDSLCHTCGDSSDSIATPAEKSFCAESSIAMQLVRMARQGRQRTCPA